MRTQSGYRAAKGASGVFPLREQRTLGQIAAWGGAPRSFQFGGGQAKYCWREALPIVVFGKTREQAMAKMRVAMAELAITGIKTNTALHRDLFADPGFQEGGVSIQYLEKWLEARKAKQNG